MDGLEYPSPDSGITVQYSPVQYSSVDAEEARRYCARGQAECSSEVVKRVDHATAMEVPWKVRVWPEVLGSADPIRSEGYSCLVSPG